MFSYDFCPNRLIWLVASATYMVNFRKKYSKSFLSETISRMKLKLGILVYAITLYKSYVFYIQCPTIFVAMAT